MIASAVEKSRLRESSCMHSESAFETCAESVCVSRSSKDILSQSRMGSCEDVPSTRVLPPTRKPVPRVNSELIEMTVPESRMSLPDPAPISSSPTPPSSVSIHSAPIQLKAKTKKKKDRKLVISHPHLNDESSPITLSNSTLPIGPKIVYSDSIGSLRDELLGNGGSLGVLAKANAKKLKKTKKQPRPPFDRYGLPNEDQLRLASDMYVYDENGRPVRFGDIFKDQKTAICSFVISGTCPLCQDYMSSIVHLTEPSLIQKAGVKLVIIGNGSPGMIKSYKTDIFHCPYEMYTDPDRKVYNALGMTLRTNDGGSVEEKGSYVKHGTFTGTMLVLKRALKMPLANAGDIKQLGGEFILGPGLNCSFASRMHTTRSHTPIRDLLQAAGVSMNPWATELSILTSPADSLRWTDAQNEDMNNMIRKGLRASCGGEDCPLDAGVEVKKQDLSEFRRLIQRLKDEGSESEPEPAQPPTTYLVEVMGQSRTELN
ncbi:AhpC/TSA antioxidant enzyme-domain-containing protein [Rhizoctonia solani]|nr:AhpC/TSA antioxidant enzyme-domain-containing protein [Rhizoctonia solani]